MSNDLASVVLKYRQLYREIGRVSDPTLRANLEHTHSKLGIFLANALGSTWRAALLAEVADEGGP